MGVKKSKIKPGIRQTPVIPAPRRLRWENHEFKARLGCIGESLSLKTKTSTLLQNLDSASILTKNK
jgi:hypothetical protein